MFTQQQLNSSYLYLKQSTTISREDLLRSVGEKVYTKAACVKSLSECSWRYGSRFNMKEICGVVFKVFTKKKSLTHNRCFTLDSYDLGRILKKRKYLNIYS